MATNCDISTAIRIKDGQPKASVYCPSCPFGKKYCWKDGIGCKWLHVYKTFGDYGYVTCEYVEAG